MANDKKIIEDLDEVQSLYHAKKTELALKKIIGSNFFALVYLSTSLSTCISRDVKGHYKQAMKGKIKNFTGIGSVFEAPKNFKLKIDTSALTIHDSVIEIAKLIEA